MTKLKRQHNVSELDTDVCHLPSAPPPHQPSKKERRITSSPELYTAPSLICSLADLEVDSPKGEAIAVERIRPWQHPRYRTPDLIPPPRLDDEEGNYTLHPSTTNPTHVPSSRCRQCIPQFAPAPGLPPKLRIETGVDAIATTEPEDTNLPQGYHRRHDIPVE